MLQNDGTARLTDEGAKDAEGAPEAVEAFL